MNDWEPGFERTRRDGQIVLVVRGEIDLSVAARFTQELDALTQAARASWSISNRSRSSIPPVSASSSERNTARWTAAPTSSCGGPPRACRRVLQLSGLWGGFAVADAV
jgi:hypothetical protein